MFNSLNQKSFCSSMRYSKRQLLFSDYEVHVKVPVDGFNICRIFTSCWKDAGKINYISYFPLLASCHTKLNVVYQDKICGDVTWL